MRRVAIFGAVAFCLLAAPRAEALPPTSHPALVGAGNQQSAPPDGITADAWQAIRAAIERDRYSAQSHPEGGIEALNPAQAYTARFTTEGVKVQPREADFELGLRLERWGYGELLEALPAVQPESEGPRIAFVRDGLTEWYVNRPNGLEQGFTIARAPRKTGVARGLLRLEMSVSGAVGEARSGSVLFKDEAGQTRLSYGGLLAWDATGREVSTRMEIVEDRLILEANDLDAVYPLTVDPVILNEDAKLTASDGAADDRFGVAVSASGDTVVVGAEDDDGSGSAYVFLEPSGGWSGPLTENAKLTASDRAERDRFGIDVSVSGDTVVVGASEDDDNGSKSGSAYVFVEPTGGWSGSLTEDAKLTASDGAGFDFFGFAVAISGDTVVVGAYSDDDNGSDSGSAYVFVEPAGGWSGSLTEDAKLTASDGATFDFFGEDVAVSGDTVAVGASGDDDNGSSSGSVYVFVEPAGGWSASLIEDAKLTASDGEELDNFGSELAVSGDTVVVGAQADDDNGTSSGSAYVFIEPAGGWNGDLTEDAKLTASDGDEFDSFGEDVAVSGDIVVVGAVGDDDNVIFTGSAYVFLEPAGGWTGPLTENAKLTASDADEFDVFGSKVAVSGATVVVGAAGDDDDSGSVYVFALLPPLFLSITGSCPGEVTISASTPGPDQPVQLFTGPGEGSSVVPTGPCTGTELDILSPRPLRALRSDENGEVSVVRTVPNFWCGRVLQAVGQACTTSNVVQFP